MKNTYQTFAKRYPKIVMGLATLVLIIMALSLKAYDKSATQADDEAIKNYKPEKLSSITNVNGDYEVNYDKMSTIYKQTLLDSLKTEVLAEKQSKTEIPAFILSFMQSISENKKFELANPGEPWCVNDIMGYTLTKMYDSKKKDTFDLITPSQKVFPNNQFVYFGIGKNMALLSYWSGGLRLSQHVAIIHFEGTKIIDYWTNNYINAIGYTKADILENLNSINNGNC